MRWRVVVRGAVVLLISSAVQARSDSPGERQEPQAASWLEGRTLPLRHHKEVAYDLVFSPDGKRLVVTVPRIVLWDVTEAKRQETVFEKGPSCFGGVGPFHFLPDDQLLFTSDGQQLLSVHSCGAITLWDAATGKVLFARKDFRAARASPDGKLLAVETKEGVAFWDVAARQAIGMPQKGSLGDFSPDGRRLVIGTPDALVILAVGGPSVAIPAGNKRMDQWGWRFSPDSRLLAVAWGDGRTTTWNASDASPAGPALPADRAVTFQSVPGGHYKRALYYSAFSSDSQRLAIFGDDGVRLWDVVTGKVLAGPPVGRSFGRATDDVFLRVRISPTGPFLAISISGYSGFLKKAGGDLDIWDVGALPHRLLEHVEDAEPIAFSPDGELLAFQLKAGYLALWSSKQRGTTFLGECRPPADHWIARPTFSADGRWIACAGPRLEDVTLWEVSKLR